MPMDITEVFTVQLDEDYLTFLKPAIPAVTLPSA